MMLLYKITAFSIAIILLIVVSVSAEVYKKSEIKAADILEGERLNITSPDNISGSVVINSVSGNNLKIEIEYTVKAESEKYFKWYLDLVDVGFSVEDEETEIKVKTPENAPWEGLDRSISLNMVISVPSNLSLNIEGRFYSIDIKGPFKNLEIDNDYGEVSASDISGQIFIKTSFKNVTLSNIEGNIDILNNSGEIKVSDVDCGKFMCRLETSKGMIRAENFKGELEAITSHAPIVLRNVDAGKGLIYMTNTYGKVKMEDITGMIEITSDYTTIMGDKISFSRGLSIITDSYNPISLKNISLDNSEVTINNDFSDVVVSFIEGESVRLILSTDEGGSIYTKGMPIEPVTISGNSFEGMVRKGESSFEVNIQGIGTIEIEGQDRISKKSY
ncbi:MAG: hypothetical protein GY855_02480 [candidate division Zixibacteria bacterium]|nr:hypothetical protein [candidate division Zixibacteria bacterium]